MERGLEQTSATTERLGEQRAEVQATSDELTRLQLKAEFSGNWLDVDPQKQPGAWVNTKEPIGILVDPHQWQIDGFVEQGDVDRLVPGASAIFYHEHRIEALHGKVRDIDTTPVARLDHPILATRYGGPIPLAAQTQDLIPAEPRFRVRIDLEDIPESMHEARGQLVLEGSRRSLLGNGLRNLLAVLIRESGF